MDLLRKLMIVLFFWFLLGSANVFAQTHNHESSHPNHSTSPFETKKKDISLHCLLKLHIQHGICPHSNSKSLNDTPISIASDCGGKSAGTLFNSTSMNYDFTEATPISLVTNDLKLGFIFDPLPHYQRLKDSISPPPKVI
jgi:hypothetical protein